MADKFYFRPVIPLLISIIAGILLGSGFPGHAIWSYIVVAVFASLLFYYIKKKKTALISPIILFVGLGYLLIQPWIAPDFSSNHVIHFTDKNKFQITGVIKHKPAIKNNRQKFILQAETLQGRQALLQVKGNINVN